VNVGEGTDTHEKLQFEKPGWTKMREGIVVDARKPGERNPFYKKYTARTLRPVVNFDTCIKCTMCWLDCPDECFEVTPSGHYEVVYEACIGCGICAQVCPVKDCIVMVDELKFTDNKDKFALYEQRPDEYRKWFTDLTGLPMEPLPEKAARSAAPAAGGD
jgi:pyruvate ferredoxin oxidoreductase delta subunit